MSYPLIAFCLISLYGAFKFFRMLRILFSREFKMLDKSPQRRIFNEDKPEIQSVELNDPELQKEFGNKAFRPLKASRSIKFSLFCLAGAYSAVTQFLVEDLPIYYLWPCLIIAWIVSGVVMASLGDFYTHIEWGDKVEKRVRSAGGKKDARFKSGYREAPKRTSYFFRPRTYNGPNYLKIYKKNFHETWVLVLFASFTVLFN